jgi:ABC-type multidrug transport system fused ATPase/permease subunit
LTAASTSLGAVDPFVARLMVEGCFAGNPWVLGTGAVGLAFIRRTWTRLTWVNAEVAVRLSISMRDRIVPHWLRREITAVDKPAPPQSSSLSDDPADASDAVIDPTSDVEKFTTGAKSISTVISSGLLAAGSMVGGLFTAPMYSLGYLASAAIVAVASTRMMKNVSENDKKEEVPRKRWQGALHEMMVGKADLDVSDSVESFGQTLSAHLREAAETTLRGMRAKSTLASTPFLAGDGFAFPLTYGLAALTAAPFTSGSMLQAAPQIAFAVIAGQRATSAMTKVMSATGDVPAAKNAFNRLVRPLLFANNNDDLAHFVEIDHSKQLGGVALEFDHPVIPRSDAFTLDLGAAPRVSVPRGGRLYLIGKNGSGKSTLLNAIVRRAALERGGIKVFDTSLSVASRTSLRRTVGVYQQTHTMFTGTVEHNIRLGRSEQELSQRELQDIFDSLQLPPEITLQSQVKVGGRVAVSGGTAARIALGRVIAGKPKILLLDEVAAALDPESKNVVETLVDDLQEKGTTIVAAMQSPAEIESRSRQNTKKVTRPHDLVLVLKGGRVEQFGTHGSLAYDDDGTYARLLKAEKGRGREEPSVILDENPPRPFNVPRQIVSGPPPDRRELAEIAGREVFGMSGFTSELLGLGWTKAQLKEWEEDSALRSRIGLDALAVFGTGGSSRPASECMADFAQRVHELVRENSSARTDTGNGSLAG